MLVTLALIGLPILGHYLWVAESSEEKATKQAHFECEDNILTAWVALDPDHLRDRLDFVDNNVFGMDFVDRGRTAEAEVLGVSEEELISLDQKILKICGPYPEYEAKFPYGR